MSTTLVKWGNSDAIRIPKEMMRRAGLKRGDSVDFEVNSAGHLELLPSKGAHRSVHPIKRVIPEDLLRAYNGNRLDNRDAWPDDALVGAEQEAWQS